MCFFNSCFYIKLKIKRTFSNDLDLDKFYPSHNPEQCSKGFIVIGQTSWTILMSAVLKLLNSITQKILNE